jgi:hypothetical protein
MKPARRGFGVARGAALAIALAGKGGRSSCGGFGPPEILASDGLLAPLAVDVLDITSGLPPIMPLLFLR